MIPLSYTHHYTFHGLNIALSANHPTLLAALHGRLRHFSSDKQETPDLVFEFYGVPATGNHLVEKPSGITRPVYDPPLGEIVYADGEDQLYINYADRVRVLCVPEQGYVRFSFGESDLENLWWLLSHPLFTLPFVELLKRRGLYSLHAAGLYSNGKGLLLAGASGAGKSTLALALVRAGFGFLSDDMLFLTPDQASLQVLAFPEEMDVTDETVSLFPELHTLLHQPKASGWVKRQVWATDCYLVDIICECRATVLVFPRVANTAKSFLQSIDQDEALLELVPNVLLTEACSSQAHLDVLAKLVRESKCYRLETGYDFETLPRLLRDLVG
jgi:hypothetical protein